MITIPKTPDIKEPHLTPAVTTLLEINQLQKELIQALRDEIAQLKGLKQKPKIKPSALEKEVSNKGDDTGTAGNSGNSALISPQDK